MGTHAGVGVSHHRNPKVAGRQAAEQALAAAGVQTPDFVFMFASVGYDQRTLLDAVREATGGAPLCGCSGEGIIVQNEADESNFSVAVMTISSGEVRFRSAIATGLRADSAAVGRTIAGAIQPELAPDTRALFVFADGLAFNFDRFVQGLEGTLSLEHPLPLFGGRAGDNFEFARTYQYCNGDVVSDGVACALLSGQARIASAVNHGCIPIGSERTVTRSEGNAIYELDGKPVLEVVKEYLAGDEIDNWAKTAVSLAMGVRAPGYMQGYDEYVIRTLLRNDTKGSMLMPTEVSEGTGVWMTRRDHEKIASGVSRIAEQITSELGDNRPKMVFQFDCSGRGKMIFREQQKLELLDTLHENLGRDIPWIGFHTYGEIAPVGGHNCFHTYTAAVVAIY